MRILLCTAPMVQINTPYPATAYLTGFLRQARPDLEVLQRDPAIDLVLRLFSKSGLSRIREVLEMVRPRNGFHHSTLDLFWYAFPTYLQEVEGAVAFLQDRDITQAARIASRRALPEGPRFEPLRSTPQLLEEFRKLSEIDRARHIASLFLDDIADVIRFGVDEKFEFARYGERLAASEGSFEPMRKNLEAECSLVDLMLEEITEEYIRELKPDVVGISAPFSGTAYGAFRMARTIRHSQPKIKVLLGGGWVNTELRELSDPRVFDYFHAITLDDGERPLLSLLEHYEGAGSADRLLRTFVREKGKVRLVSDPALHDIPFRNAGIPTYEGLPWQSYVSMFEMLNPVNRLWTGWRWNKLTLAHGCYWKRCSFCDVTLDYIGRFEPEVADRIVDKMVKIHQETGFDGFHFVDEAAPPAILRALSERLISRGLQFRWWGNIRFDKNFTPELTELMAKAGCIAVTGGLEVASPRLLELIQKGVTIPQVARVTKAFANAGIFVHAYLMYGFPTQTVQETVDSLEVLRQLFHEGCLKSAFWHRLSVTVHSPISREPDRFGVKLLPPRPSAHGVFAKNDVPFHDPTPTPHEELGEGLRHALYNYMHGIGLEADVKEWFSLPVPATTVAPGMISRALRGTGD